MKKLDSDRILREIREDIQTKKIDPSALLPFGSIPVLSRDELGEPGREMAELDDSLSLVNANWDILKRKYAIYDRDSRAGESSSS